MALLTTAEVAVRLGCSRAAVRSWVRSGKLTPAIAGTRGRGQAAMFEPSDVDAFSRPRPGRPTRLSREPQGALGPLIPAAAPDESPVRWIGRAKEIAPSRVAQARRNHRVLEEPSPREFAVADFDRIAFVSGGEVSVIDYGRGKRTTAEHESASRPLHPVRLMNLEFRNGMAEVRRERISVARKR